MGGRSLVGDRVEWLPFASRARTLELQRDSEALLLLIPEAGGRGNGILSGKVFEYLAAGRPVVASSRPDGAAARLLRQTGAGIVVAPDDVEGAARALELSAIAGAGATTSRCNFTPEQHRVLSRASRVTELAALLRSLLRPEVPSEPIDDSGVGPHNSSRPTTPEV